MRKHEYTVVCGFQTEESAQTFGNALVRVGRNHGARSFILLQKNGVYGVEFKCFKHPSKPAISLLWMLPVMLGLDIPIDCWETNVGDLGAKLKHLRKEARAAAPAAPSAAPSAAAPS